MTDSDKSKQQDISGNALEYATAMQLACVVGSHIEEDNVSEKARADFRTQSIEERIWLMRSAGVGVAHIMATEDDALQFADDSVVIMQPDSKGREGDPRDVLLSLKKGHLGISVKRNNDVEKNQRLQRGNTDFAAMWRLGVNASSRYAKKIENVFLRLDAIRKTGATKWSEVPNKHEEIYAPVLDAFAREFESLAQQPKVCRKFANYVTGGAFDYYKIMAYPKKTIVQGYNFGGKLSCGKQTPPKSLLSLSRKINKRGGSNSTTTLTLAFDGGWVFTMRIHNATAAIENSLKWDVRLVAHPANVYVHHVLL